MRIDILTLFPAMFGSALSESMIKRARQKAIVTITAHNLRDWTHDRHRTTDDIPYGGGPGMVMKVEPVYEALQSLLGRVTVKRNRGSGASRRAKRRVILLTPQGKKFNQKLARELSLCERLVFICGHYEGTDERIRRFVTDEISIGDYVLTCGEIPAMVVVDSVVRLLPGVLGDSGSLKEESFEKPLLEYPHYTRPRVFKGMRVPEILLSGDHKLIKLWRSEEALKRTRKRRPDLLRKLH